jgi:hypothetical protein
VPDTDNRNYFGFGATAGSSGSTYAVLLAPNSSQFGLQLDTYGNSSPFTDLADVSGSFPPGAYWYKVTVVWRIGGTITANLFASDGTTLLDTVTAVDNTITSSTIAFRAYNPEVAVAAFDTVTLLSPTTAPEPSTFGTTLGLLLCGVLMLRRARLRTAGSQGRSVS